MHDNLKGGIECLIVLCAIIYVVGALFTAASRHSLIPHPSSLIPSSEVLLP